jgi:hypothetical protein
MFRLGGLASVQGMAQGMAMLLMFTGRGLGF